MWRVIAQIKQRRVHLLVIVPLHPRRDGTLGAYKYLACTHLQLQPELFFELLIRRCRTIPRHKSVEVVDGPDVAEMLESLSVDRVTHLHMTSGLRVRIAVKQLLYIHLLEVCK